MGDGFTVPPLVDPARIWMVCTLVADGPDTFAELKVKEIKNSGFAMFSMFGHYVQAIVTDQGPVENWASHIADPLAVNGFALFGKFLISVS